MNPYYRDYSDFLAGLFEGKIQKLSIDIAATCPNRDGSLGRGGCIYCNNDAFAPDAPKRGLPVAEQLRRGKTFFGGKYPQMRYLAYFQSFTSTYGNYSAAMEAFDEALSADTVGIVIGTRPDCLPDSVIADLVMLRNKHGKEIIIEFGVESMHDRTLRRINRGHDSSCTIDAIGRAANANLHVGLHLIMGLPGESIDDMLQTVRQISSLPVETVKFHQLQILTGTILARMYANGMCADCIDFTPDSYADLCIEIIDALRPDIAIDRFVASAPAGMLIHPKWGMKNYQFINLLHKKLADRNTSRSAL